MSTDANIQKLHWQGPLHRKVLEAIRARHKLASDALSGRRAQWKKDEDAYQTYIPERDADAIRRVKREDEGLPQYTTIVVPYSYAILMTLHTYTTSVFLGRSPVFQFEGRHGDSDLGKMALEAFIAYQVMVGEHLVPYYILFLDAPKYGMGVLGVHWEEEKIQVARVERVPATFLGLPVGGKTRLVETSETVQGYVGNKVYNVRPYNFLWDTRVPLGNFQQGEFVITEDHISSLDLREGDWIEGNVEAAIRARGFGGAGADFFSDVGNAVEAPDYDAELYSAEDLKDTKQHVVWDVHIRLNPSKWGLSSRNISEKWVFTVINGQVIVGARPLGAYHDKFPFIILEHEPDGYALAKRSLFEVLKPLQNTLDWLVNSHFYNVRETLNNNWIIDPSLVRMSDVTDPLPGKRIRMRPRGYGKGLIDKAIHQLEIKDVTQGHMRDISVLIELFQRASGVTDAVMGIPLPTGRRTAAESRITSGFGVNRLRTISEFYSAQGFQPLSMMLVQNTQQYWTGEQMFRVAGDLIDARAAGKFVNVTPETIRGFFDFIPIDGTLPIDRFAQASLWRDMIGMMSKSPQLLAGFDMGGIFAWVAKLAGLKSIDQFRINIQPDAAVAAAAGAGNVVPLGGVDGRGGGSGAVAGGPAQPAGVGQASGVGPVRENAQ